MAGLTDGQIDFLINYDYSEFEKIPEKLDLILEELQKDNASDSENLILEELQKDNESTMQFQSFMMTEEVLPVEEVEPVPVEESPPSEEIPVRENAPVPTGEEETIISSEPQMEVLAVGEEVPPDYQKLAYDELVLMNMTLIDNQVEMVEHLEQLEIHIGKSAEADTQFSFYLLWILPLIVAIIFFKSVFNPFVRV